MMVKLRRVVLRIRVWTLGAIEFRGGVGMSYGEDYDLTCTYDAGRDFAHRVTFRYWDDTRP